MTSRAKILLVGLGVLLVSPGDAPAQLGTASSTAACCNLTTSLANDALRGGDLQGDERFFMSEGAPPNLHFLIDTSSSMQDLPYRTLFTRFTVGDPAYEGCANAEVRADQLARGWDPTRAYPPPDLGTGLGADTGFPNLFQENRFYTAFSWYDYGSNPQANNDPPPRPETTAEAVCRSVHPAWQTDPTDAQRCERCLNERGYYLSPNAASFSQYVFSGKFLNFAPPRYVTLRSVLKNVIRDLRRARIGYSTFADYRAGATLRQRQNPSCDVIARDPSAFDNNRASYINDINRLQFLHATPLGSALFNIGQYFSSGDDVYTSRLGIAPEWLDPNFRNAPLTSQDRSWCWNCQASSVIVITDGAPTWDDRVPRDTVIALNGGPVTCPDYDGNGIGDCSAEESSARDDLLDDVARLLHTRDLQVSTPEVVGDLDTRGTQRLDIHGIAIGLQSAMLRNATEGVGGGRYFEANTYGGLRDAIFSIVQTVQTRATAFTAASVSTLQLNRAGGAFIPRFVPAAQGRGAPWQGALYRFEIAQERVLGCRPEQASGGGDAADLNGDGDCNDAHLIDRDQDAIIEDNHGAFVKRRDGTTPAVPFWEAGEVLKGGQGATTSWRTRRIYTVIDNGGPNGAPDGRLDRHDTPVAFTEANAPLLREYLGIPDSPNACVELAASLGLSALSADDCARLVIRYYRGADELNPDPLLRSFDRPNLLHDIFHSAPILVEPLADRVGCGIGTQCVQTLYLGETPLDPDGAGGQPDAWDQAVAARGARDKIVLVGSNGGMLHAFHAGTAGAVSPDTGLVQYDAGTGEEQWAFIPPDLLPKLRPNLGVHGYFVDGTPMVRDVWVDENQDRRKQREEFRTVAVVGEGAGGVHRFALDLTRLIGTGGASNPPDTRGDFLWTWPQPCDDTALLVGESSGNFAPKPPPIGPVAIERPGDGHYDVGGIRADERWIVMVNGGYDPWGARGRLLAMLDIGTGQTVWSMAFGDGKPNADQLRHPFAAPVALMDLGEAMGSTADGDLLFDTATVADYGGNVWTVRFWVPGQRSNGSGEVTNWYAARSFQSAGASDETVRSPFAQMTSNAIQPETGWLRTFIGSGDRQNILDAPGTLCRLSNPRGCAWQGCQVTTGLTIERGGTQTLSVRSLYSQGRETSTSFTQAAAGPSCRSARMSVSWQYTPAGSCRMRESGSVEYTCDGSQSSWACRQSANDWVARQEPQVPPPAASADRFYGFWSYGVHADRRFNTASEAIRFDDTRLTEAVLQDVTAATADAAGDVTGTAGSLQNGWYIRYANVSERTGSGSTIVDGCVLWNAFEPGGGASMCGTAGLNTARLFQSQFVSGAPNCAQAFFDPVAGWQREVARPVVAVPGDPTPVRVVYGGVGSTSVLTTEAGRSEGMSVSESRELLQAVYQIEVDRALHDCRHENGAACE